MIWQSFVDETILGTSQVAKAAIHGLDGTRFASSTGFVVCYITLHYKVVNLIYNRSEFHYTDGCVNIYVVRFLEKYNVDFSRKIKVHIHVPMKLCMFDLLR